MVSAPIDPHVEHLYVDALAARSVGDLERAHRLLIEAVEQPQTYASRLWLTLRATYLYAYMRGELASVDSLIEIANDASAAQLRGIEADAQASLAAAYVEHNMAAVIASMAQAISVAAIAPDSAELALPLINIGVSCGILGLSAAARSHFERGMRLNLNNQHAEYLKASLGDALASDALARPLVDPDRLDLLHQAVALCSEALANRTTLGELIAESHCLRTRAVCFIELGRFDEADADLADLRTTMSGLRTDPTFGDVHYIDAAIRWHRNQDPAILDALQLSRPTMTEGRGLPVLVRVMRLRAEVYRKIGAVDTAFATLGSLAQHQLATTRRERDLRSGFLDLTVELLNAQALSLQDPLTGLPNRRALQRDLDAMLQRGGSVVVAAIDLDRFKLVNDNVGYQAGDEVIRQLSGVLLRSLRRNDVVARLGGDEFIVAMPSATAADGQARLEEIRRAVANFDWSTIDAGLSLTASIGAVFGLADDRPLADLWIVDASVALRTAKASGRNNVALSH
jgi:diguanylate cyclase (GGDEF)-like protein